METNLLNILSVILGIVGSAILAYRVTGILKALALVADAHEVNIEQLMNNVEKGGKQDIYHLSNATKHVKNAEKRFLLILGFFLIIAAAVLQLFTLTTNVSYNITNVSEVWNGVIIGGAGGAIAGITVLLIKYIHTKSVELIHKQRVYSWLKDTTFENKKPQFRSTIAIASWCNLTEDRVRYICSIHKKVYLSTGKNEDIWGIYTREPRSGFV